MVRNFEYLDDYYRSLESPPTLPPESVAQALAAVAATPGLTKAELARQELPIASDTIHWLIVQGKLYVDLARCPLVDADQVRVYLDSDQAQMYELCATAARPAWMTRREPLRCEPGTPLVWDGKPWIITNVGATRIFLQLQDGTASTPVAMDQAQLQRLTEAGHISAVRVEGSNAQERGETLGSAWGHSILSAHPNALQRALHRYRQLQRFQAGDLTVLDEVSSRSLYGFLHNWRVAEAAGQPGFTGLVDRHANSGRTSQLSDEARALVQRSVREDYGSQRQLTVLAAYRAYQGRCLAVDMLPVSYETYRKAVLQQLPAEQTQRRRGRRAAYADAPFVALGHGNRHGDYPLQRAHKDHTQLDLEVVSPFGDLLGRPWLTLLLDAYSRRVLAFFLTFDPPSYRSCMMVARECVRRNRRMPLILIHDNGPEFRSVYWEMLLATFEVTQETRPPAKPRFGSVIERLVGTLNSEVIHTLQGNTQIMKHVREVTKSVNPRGQAVWTLPALYDALTEWCYDVYDQQPHQGLHGRSPREVFLAGQAQAGARSHRPIEYNEQFLRLTEPSTPKGTARFGIRGLAKVNNIVYYCPKLVRFGTGGRGTDVHVRYDPWDFGHIHALVDGEWEECRANNYDVFHYRSEREIALATEEIRALDRQAGRAPSVSHARIVAYFQQIQQHEEVLRQHLRDQEMRRALAGNAASMVTVSEWGAPLTAPAPLLLPGPLAASINQGAQSAVSAPDDDVDNVDEVDEVDDAFDLCDDF